MRLFHRTHAQQRSLNVRCAWLLLSFASPQFWSAEDFKCRRTIVSSFEVEILMVSAKGQYVFVVGETSGGGVGCGRRGRRKARKNRAVIAVWDGRKRGKIYPGYGGERDPARLLAGHGGAIQSLFTPDDPGELLLGEWRPRALWNGVSRACLMVVAPAHGRQCRQVRCGTGSR